MTDSHHVILNENELLRYACPKFELIGNPLAKISVCYCWAIYEEAQVNGTTGFLVTADHGAQSRITTLYGLYFATDRLSKVAGKNGSIISRNKGTKRRIQFSPRSLMNSWESCYGTWKNCFPISSLASSSLCDMLSMKIDVNFKFYWPTKLRRILSQFFTCTRVVHESHDSTQMIKHYWGNGGSNYATAKIVRITDRVGRTLLINNDYWPSKFCTKHVPIFHTDCEEAIINVNTSGVTNLNINIVNVVRDGSCYSNIAFSSAVKCGLFHSRVQKHLRKGSSVLTGLIPFLINKDGKGLCHCQSNPNPNHMMRAYPQEFPIKYGQFTDDLSDNRTSNPVNDIIGVPENKGCLFREGKKRAVKCCLFYFQHPGFKIVGVRKGCTYTLPLWKSISATFPNPYYFKTWVTMA